MQLSSVQSLSIHFSLDFLSCIQTPPPRRSKKGIKMSKTGSMAASNVLMLKKATDKRQEQALNDAFKVNHQGLDKALQAAFKVGFPPQ